MMDDCPVGIPSVNFTSDLLSDNNSTQQHHTVGGNESNFNNAITPNKITESISDGLTVTDQNSVRVIKPQCTIDEVKIQEEKDRCSLQTNNPSENAQSEEETVTPTNPSISLARQKFLVPERHNLPDLSQYAQLFDGNHSPKTVGYVEASRGCKHLCRHCPIVPVYQGQFRIIQRNVVLEDIRQQVAMGAEHITFGDPDLFDDGVVRIWLDDDTTDDINLEITNFLAPSGSVYHVSWTNFQSGGVGGATTVVDLNAGGLT